MFIQKFVSTVLIVGLTASTALAGTATRTNPRTFAVSPRKFDKVNTVLKKAVNDLTNGKGSITIGDLRKKLRTHMTPADFATVDAKLGKAPQSTRVTFSVKGSEVKYTSSYETGWLRVNNNMKKFIEVKGRAFTIDEVRKAFKPNGPVTYSAPASVLEYVSNLIIPSAHAEGFLGGLFGSLGGWGGVLIGAAAAIFLPKILDQLGIYDFNRDESRDHWIGWWDECNQDDKKIDADCDAVNAREDGNYDNLPGEAAHRPADDPAP